MSYAITDTAIGLGIAFPIIWILTVSLMDPLTMRDLIMPKCLGIIAVLLVGQYYYYVLFIHHGLGAICGALVFVTIRLISDPDSIPFGLHIIRAFVLEYGLLLLPSALYATIGAGLWILSVAIATSLCHHL